MHDPSRVGEARRIVSTLACNLGFDATAAGHLAIITTEAANNLALHATGGRLVLQPYSVGDSAWIELLALDTGPGMADLAKCLGDGYSTIGTAGQGLGAISRLADLFDVYSVPGKGTALLARVACSSSNSSDRCAAVGGRTFGALSVPNDGEKECGDTWCIACGNQHTLAMVVDGLGHGPLAAEAAIEARRIFTENPGRSPEEIIKLAHGALRKTRGAAMAVLRIDATSRVVEFSGLGNISGSVWSGTSARGMVSQNGIVGHGDRRLSTHTYPFPPGAWIIMHSDGISGRFSPESFPGALQRHPAILAGLIFRDCARGRDDATILILGPVS